MAGVLILGANSDIAIALADVYATKGYSLILASRGEEQLNTTASQLKEKYNAEVEVHQFDATKFDEHDSFLEAIKTPYEIVVCAFGAAYKNDKSLEEFELTKEVIDVNYTGAVSILNEIAQNFKAKQSGSIVGISSVAGEKGRQTNVIYCSAKAGFTAYLQGLRNYLYAHKVHVLTVNPGYVDTKMTAGMDTPGWATASPQLVAKRIFKAQQRKKNVLYVKSIWRLIMWVIRSIPEWIFKRMKL
jgi:decaprenylphospho-beta-D-erythro-pentofuranosid-2-ulose 2-reductase